MTPDEWIYATLLRLSDPTVSVDISRLAGIPPQTLWRCLAIARVHGILGLVLDKLQAIAGGFPEVWKTAQRSWRGEFIKSIRMRRHAEVVLHVLADKGIPAFILKGTDFADQLYPNPALRPARDVDVLIPRDRWNDAVAALCSIGHVQKGPQPNTAAFPWTKGQGSWRGPPPSNATVELHWNLINARRWRRHASVEHNHLAAPISIQRGIPVLSPAARFIVAALHPVCHHQFDRMVLLTDIRQACRHVGQGHHLQILDIMQRTGTQATVDISLGITAHVLHDSSIEVLRQRLADQSGTHSIEIPEFIYESADNLVRTVAFHRGMRFRRRLRRWVYETS